MTDEIKERLYKAIDTSFGEFETCSTEEEEGKIQIIQNLYKLKIDDDKVFFSNQDNYAKLKLERDRLLFEQEKEKSKLKLEQDKLEFEKHKLDFEKQREETRTALEQDKLEFEKRREEIHEQNLKLEDLNKNIDRKIKICITVGEIMVPLLFYGAWLNKGLKFEENGAITSLTFRNFINHFKPTKTR